MEPTIENLLQERVSAEAMTLYERVRDYGPLSLEDLCDKGDGTASHWRRLLYELQDARAIGATRVTRERRIYYLFQVTPRNFSEGIAKVADSEAAALQTELDEVQGNQYYACQGCGRRLRFEEAFAFDFNCGRCDRTLLLVDPTTTTAALATKIRGARDRAKSAWSMFAKLPSVRLDKAPATPYQPKRL